MEGAVSLVGVPYSIPAFINEDTNGLFNPRDGGTVWTTVQTVDPATVTSFVPQQLTYANLTANSPSNPLSMFDEMMMAVQFEPPDTHRQYFEDPVLNKQIIAASRAGRKNIQVLLREGQDHYVVGPQDSSYNHPMYNMIPIVYVEQLDTATLYVNAGSTDTVAEGSANFANPRYYWINGNYCYPVFHDEVFFEKQEIRSHPNQVDTWVCPMLTWYNIINPSRRRQGILSPSF